MKCPVCATEMDEHARHRVKIDHCPACGGVWLDKGELDHLIAAVRPAVVLPDPDPPRPAPTPETDRSSDAHAARRKAPNRERVEDRGRASGKTPGRAHRYGERYSRQVTLADVLEEIFDFD